MNSTNHLESSNPQTRDCPSREAPGTDRSGSANNAVAFLLLSWLLLVPSTPARAELPAEGGFDRECSAAVLRAVRRDSNCLWSQVSRAAVNNRLNEYLETSPESEGKCLSRLTKRLTKIARRFEADLCPDLTAASLHGRAWDFVIEETATASHPDFQILTARNIRYYTEVTVENQSAASIAGYIPRQSVGLHDWEWDQVVCTAEFQLAPGESFTCRSPVKDYAGSAQVYFGLVDASHPLYYQEFGTNHCGSALNPAEDPCGFGTSACVGTTGNRGDGDLQIIITLDDHATSPQCEAGVKLPPSYRPQF